MFGDWAVEQVGYTVIAESIGPLVKTQIEEALKSGSGPEALFAQLSEMAKTAVRPLRTVWTSTQQNAGRLELIYPRALEKETAMLWRGAIRYAFELTRRESGKVVSETQGPPGHLTWELSW